MDRIDPSTPRSSLAASNGDAPADRAIVMMGCIGGALTLVVVTIVALTTGAVSGWLAIGPAGGLLLAFGAWRAWRLVRVHGFYHDQVDEEEDEDGNPEGGSGVRFPPDAPDGGGSLEFDWDAFVAGFWDHIDAQAREPALS